MPHILIIDCYDSFTYNIYHYLDYLNNGNVGVLRYDELAGAELSGYSHIVLSPGPGLPSDYPDIIKLILSLRHKTNFFGVCLGLQSLIVAFGGQLKRLDAVKHGISSELTLMPPSTLFAGIDLPMEIGHYHSWVADPDFFPGDEFRITSRDSALNIMSIEHHSLPIFAVQFHPESVLTPSGMGVFKNWLGLKSS